MSGLLTHAVSDIIRELLIDLTLGTEPDDSLAWPIHIKTEPDKPNSAITINDTPGTNDGRVMQGEQQINPGVQIRVRAEVASVGKTKIDVIKDTIDLTVLRTSVTFNLKTYLIQNISTSQINDLGKDPFSGRNLFTLNATINLRETT